MLIKLLLAGDGGQGIQLMSDIITRAAFERGFYVSHIPNYGLEQRGGVSLAFIQISDQEIVYPKFTQPDILLIMSEQARERTTQYQHPSLYPSPIRGGAGGGVNRETLLDIGNYKEMLAKNNINPQSYNIFFLGALTKILAEKKICSRDEIFKLLETKLGLKSGWEENKKAFEAGFQR